MPAVEALARRERSRSKLRNWPFWVILLAVVAMVAALVLLLWPQHSSSTRGRKPLSNDRMDTSTPPGQQGKGLDPWSGDAPDPGADALDGAGAPGSRAPVAPPPDDPDGSSADDDDAAAAADLDPSGGVGVDLVDPAIPDAPAPGPDPFHSGSASRRPQDVFMGEVVRRLCRRMAACGSGDPMMLALCSALPSHLPPVSARCYSPTAAAACLRTIDRLPCDDQISMSLLQGMPACLSLLSC